MSADLTGLRRLPAEHPQHLARPRLRCRFSKVGRVRFVGHRDLARVWERAIRRIGFPVSFSEGFTPRPKVSFGLALPTGHQSLGEYLDIEVDPGHCLVDDDGVVRAVVGVGVADGEAMDWADLAARLSSALPNGVEVATVAAVDGGESLQEAVTACTWTFCVWGLGVDEAEAGIAGVMSASALPIERERKGKVVTDDLRPHILGLTVIDGPPDGAEGDAVIEAELAAKPRVVRPAEVVDLLRPGAAAAHAFGPVTRTHQWIERDGARREPLVGPGQATGAPHAEACVS